ncbi:hypothetical protein EVAR_37166_1 [Eumeta japonica]|uniref:Uncharacterized protein n=1 Tax=Eumeta variegata TaxID=151549 RepID=A0A4C1WL31_EUMVA|nr:hypothetical protein EVAR_37166_1 [Eumeta japonica]
MPQSYGLSACELSYGQTFPSSMRYTNAIERENTRTNNSPADNVQRTRIRSKAQPSARAGAAAAGTPARAVLASGSRYFSARFSRRRARPPPRR